jgi:hypothetical protein
MMFVRVGEEAYEGTITSRLAADQRMPHPTHTLMLHPAGVDYFSDGV